MATRDLLEEASALLKPDPKARAKERFKQIDLFERLHALLGGKGGQPPTN